MKKILIATISSIFLIFSFTQNSFSYDNEYSDIADRVFQKLEDRYSDYSDIKKLIFYNYLIVKLDKISQEIDNYEIKQIIVHLKNKLNSSSESLTGGGGGTSSDLGSPNGDLGSNSNNTNNTGGSNTNNKKYYGGCDRGTKVLKHYEVKNLYSKNRVCSKTFFTCDEKVGKYYQDSGLVVSPGPGVPVDGAKLYNSSSACKASLKSTGADNGTSSNNSNTSGNTNNKKYYGRCDGGTKVRKYYELHSSYGLPKRCSNSIFTCDRSKGKYYDDAQVVVSPGPGVPADGAMLYNSSSECKASLTATGADNGTSSNNSNTSGNINERDYFGKCSVYGTKKFFYFTMEKTCRLGSFVCNANVGKYYKSQETVVSPAPATTVIPMKGTGIYTSKESCEDAGRSIISDPDGSSGTSSNSSSDNGNTNNKKYYGRCDGGTKVRKYYELHSSYGLPKRCSNSIFTCDRSKGKYYDDAQVVVSPGPGVPADGAMLYNSSSECKASLTATGADNGTSSSTSASCFSVSDGVIEEYYKYENNSNLGDACPLDVIIPSSIGGAKITSIGYGVFRYKNLTSVTIPDTVTTIGEWSFSDNSLTNVTIPDSVTTIGWAAFRKNNLTSVIIPDSVTTIGRSSFGHNRLTNVTISNSVTHIGNHAFNVNNLTSVIIPNSVTTIGWAAFANNKLTSVTIPNKVTSLGYQAFWSNKLKSVTIPNSLTSIGYRAFYNNDLVNVTIPNVNTKCYDSNSGTSGSTSLSGFKNCFDSSVNITHGASSSNNSNTSGNINEEVYYGKCSVYGTKKFFYFTMAKTCRLGSFVCNDNVGKYYKFPETVVSPAPATTVIPMKGTGIYSSEEECLDLSKGIISDPDGSSGTSSNSSSDNGNTNNKKYYGRCDGGTKVRKYYELHSSYGLPKRCSNSIFTCDRSKGKYYDDAQVVVSPGPGVPADGAMLYNSSSECKASLTATGVDNGNTNNRKYYGRCDGGTKVLKYYKTGNGACASDKFTCDRSKGKYYSNGNVTRGAVVSPTPIYVPPVANATLYNTYAACKSGSPTGADNGTSSNNSNTEIKAIPSSLIMNLSSLNIKNYVTTNVFGIGESDMEVCLAAITHFNPKAPLGVTCNNSNAKYYSIQTTTPGWKYLGSNKWSFTSNYTVGGYGTKGGTNVRVYFRNKNNPSKNGYFSIITVGSVGSTSSPHSYRYNSSYQTK